MPGESNGPVCASSPPNSPDRDDDDDYLRDLRRPAAIKEDLCEMERRKRVREVLESKPFLLELENLIKDEKKHGNNAENLRALEQLSDLILPKPQLTHAGPLGVIGGPAVKPIADLKDAEAKSKYNKLERLLRNKFASLFRLIELFNWAPPGLYNHMTKPGAQVRLYSKQVQNTLRMLGVAAHNLVVSDSELEKNVALFHEISLRVTQDNEHILINPHGLHYHEISASSLAKVDFAGNVLDAGSSGLGINLAEYCLHSTIHQFRPDVKCIIHLHSPVVGAVAAMKCGFLPISQEALCCGPVSYHDFNVSDAAEFDDEKRDALTRALGPINKVLLLKNRGFVACGASIEEAFDIAFHLIHACETQIIILPSNGFVVCGESVEDTFFLTTNLVNACEAQVRAARAGIENLNIPTEEAVAAAFAARKKSPGKAVRRTDSGISWRPGELEWEAWMRVLDNAGFRPGHIYRQPLLKIHSAPPQSDVEVPPATSAYGTGGDSAEPLSPHKLAALKAAQEKVRWLNSPNTYQKVEIVESGTEDPRTITRWIPDSSSPQHSNAIKIESPHQFAPIANGENPKEFREKQKADAYVSGTGEHIIVVGAASKGIIQKQYQDNAQMYRQVYQPNPFANETEEDIEKYKRQIESKHSDGAAAIRQDSSDYGGMDNSATQSPESCSLMQIKVASRSQEEGEVKSKNERVLRETTFGAGPEEKTTTRILVRSPVLSYFRRTKSDRYPRRHKEAAGDGEKATSDNETNPEKKKDKKKMFNFFGKKKKDSGGSSSKERSKGSSREKSSGSIEE